MSSWTTRWNHIWSKARTVGADSFHLAVAMGRKARKESARDVVFAQARLSNNAVAASLLRVDKEVSLFRYWGFLGYLKEKQIGASWPPMAKRLFYGGSSSGGDNNDNPKNKPVARVAFMITSTQRTELSERLGYDQDHIKALKPVEASLILEHNLSPDEADKQLAGLVQEYNEAQAKQQQEVKNETERIQTAITSATDSFPQTPVEDQQPLLLSKSQTESSSTEDGSSKYVFDEPIDTPTEGTVWYEVFETRTSDGSAIPVALYRNEDEAKFCLELKEEFAQRNARERHDGKLATTYTIRKTTK